VEGSQKEEGPEPRFSFYEIIGLIVVIVMISIAQAYTGANGLLTFLVGILIGAVATYFGKEYVDYAKQRIKREDH